ncbi:hypothetical protein T265_10716 [Opisthorchis viverrini]|uniref:Tctex-1 family protein n=1 Tax=Opisthorchis viverrini TaxID=6198 RepID=A0A074Z1G3_OPIVI|nr:hypothetical protein T265_10716 [Opisthorchis viverrini]KER20813.1 hypothetical protein T265_10716 [Opisthorchis viverrini]
MSASRKQSSNMLKLSATSVHGRRMSSVHSTLSWEPMLLASNAPTENTYQLQPAPNREFNTKEAEEIIRQNSIQFFEKYTDLQINLVLVYDFLQLNVLHTGHLTIQLARYSRDRTSYLGSNLDEYTIRGSKVLPFVQRRFAFQPDHSLACQIADAVRQSLSRELASTDTKHGGRHKLVVHVLHENKPVGLNSVGLTVSSCGLWDPATDRWVQVAHRSPWGLFLILAFACYYE